MAQDFEQIYKTYYMKVYSYALRLSGNSDLAEEITQKTFFKALTSESVYCGDSSLFTWLCAVAKNLFYDETRKNKKQCELTNDAAYDNGMEQQLLNKDTAFRVHQVLHNLEEPYKEVFQLRVFGELPFLKIGELFSKTENWARVTYYRARLKIQEGMEDL